MRLLLLLLLPLLLLLLLLLLLPLLLPLLLLGLLHHDRLDMDDCVCMCKDVRGKRMCSYFRSSARSVRKTTIPLFN